MTYSQDDEKPKKSGAFLGHQGNYHYAGTFNEYFQPLIALPEWVPFQLYSSLMGLLMTSGASLGHGPNWYWHPDSIILKMSNRNLEFLKWLISYFAPMFRFPNSYYQSSTTWVVNTAASFLCLIIYVHWKDITLKGILPSHFAEYFSIHTLAFIAMRNGQYLNNTFAIGISKLTLEDKILLMKLIESKLGYSSKLTMKDKRLAISNPESLVKELRPLFHKS